MEGNGGITVKVNNTVPPENSTNVPKEYVLKTFVSFVKEITIILIRLEGLGTVERIHRIGSGPISDMQMSFQYFVYSLFYLGGDRAVDKPLVWEFQLFPRRHIKQRVREEDT